MDKKSIITNLENALILIEKLLNAPVKYQTQTLLLIETHIKNALEAIVSDI